MPTYRKNPEAVSKLTSEQYRVTQTDGNQASLRQRIPEQTSTWFLASRSSHPSTSSTVGRDGRVSRGRSRPKASSRTLTARTAWHGPRFAPNTATATLVTFSRMGRVMRPALDEVYATG
jgi:hypothetical protein